MRGQMDALSAYMYRSMPSLNDTLFGPLDKDYCLYFYFLALYSLVIAGFIFCVLMMMIFSGKKMDFNMVFILSYGILYYLAFYLQNRLLNSMCRNK